MNKMTKKLGLLVLACLLTLSLLTGCGATGEPIEMPYETTAPAPEVPDKPSDDDDNVGGGSTGGSSGGSSTPVENYSGLQFTELADGTYSVSAKVKSLTKVTVPAVYKNKNVSCIAERGFEDCTKLESVEIANGVSVIGNYAFQSCTALKTVTLGASVSEIGNDAFTYCPALKTVTLGNVLTIGENAFQGCASLETMELPATLKSVGNRAFALCDKLISKSDDGVSYVGNWVIACDAEATEVTLREGTVGIAANAFKDCEALEAVTFSAELRVIGENAFEGCTALITAANVEGGVTYVGKWVIACDKTATAVVLRADTVGFASGAFADCAVLESILIPETVVNIGASAFSGCASLTSITVPATVKNIGVNAFVGCTSLESLSVPFLGTAADAANATVLGTLFGAASFEGNAAAVPATLKSVTVTGECVIVDNAFNGCNMLETIAIEKATAIGKNALKGCSTLKNLTVPFVGATATDTATAYLAYFFGAASADANVNQVADSLRSVSVVGNCAILANAFANCEFLDTVVLTNVTSIGERAFWNCASLKNITFGDKLASIEKNAFADCASLASASFALTEGWKADGEAITLETPAAAATALKTTYRTATWTFES